MNIEDFAENLAKEAAGNWKRFESFAWFDQPDDADNWVIINIEHRDSGLLDQSNAEAMRETLKEYNGDDVGFERHSHWAVGWTEAVCIRVYNSNGEITDAFKAFSKLKLAMEDYPVLDEEDYSRREYEATLENIENNLPWFGDHEKPENVCEQVFSWLWNNNQREVENIDDQGGYPSEEAIKKALDDLKIKYES